MSGTDELPNIEQMHAGDLLEEPERSRGDWERNVDEPLRRVFYDLGVDAAHSRDGYGIEDKLSALDEAVERTFGVLDRKLARMADRVKAAEDRAARAEENLLRVSAEMLETFRVLADRMENIAGRVS